MKKNPWDKGWIPPRTKKHAVHRPAPEGWVRIRRSDCTHYVRQGSGVMLQDVILGKPGTKWRLWLDYGPDGRRPADFESKSLDALLMWYKLETADRQEPPLEAPTGRRSKVYSKLLGTMIHTAFIDERTAFIDEYIADMYSSNTLTK